MKPLFTRRYRHIGRYREIVNVISKHGLGHLADYWGVNHGIPWRKNDNDQQPLNMAQRLRMVLEELGPTFIKLGQILSTRPDILPPAYIDELEKLQDRVPPTSFEEIKATLNEELNLPIGSIFIRLDEKPMASASIGQVHEASLISGEHVVVKVQRAGVARVIETDLEIMTDMARMIEARTEWGRYYQITGMVEEFARSIREELDYTREGNNADRIRRNFIKDPTVNIPLIFWPYSTKKVLVMQYVEGIKITNEEELKFTGINRAVVARSLTNAVFKQILIDGFFHADPHPGNISVSQNDSIIFMDFGMVGRLDNWMQQRLGKMLLQIVRQDVDGIVKTLIELGNARRKVDKASLKRDINYLFDKYFDRPLGQVKIGHALRELLQMSYVYRIRVPVEMVLMIRCLILLEGTVERIDPQASIMDLAEPFGKRLLQEQFSPLRIAEAIFNYARDLSAISFELPKHMDNLIQTVEDGELKINLEHKNFNKFITRLNLVGNRISFSLVVASIIIGSSLIAQHSSHSILWRFPIAEAGFIIASLLGLWLLISIIRSGRI